MSSTMAVDPPAAMPTSAATKGLTIADILKTISYIVRGVELGQPRLLQRAIRQNASLRKYITTEQLKFVIDKYIPETNPSIATLNQCLDRLPKTTISTGQAGDTETVGAGIKGMEIADEVADAGALSGGVSVPPTLVLPEVEVFLFTLVVTTMLRNGLNGEAAYAATALIERVKTFNRRSLDIFSSKAYFYFSLAHEKIQRLENIRPALLALYRTACVRHDEMGQAVLLNLTLRNYLHYNLVEQAQTLSSKAGSFPETASNNQFCRYLFYMGRVQALQLEYSDAYMRLMMASRKAPQDCAAGFSRMVYKLVVIVQLLMGDIPERALFNQPEMRAALHPYLQLTQAVRVGDVKLFSQVVEQYGAAFKADKNYTLVQRLGHNVLKTGLRKISVSYSRISLTDVAAKLHLPTAAAAGYICAKAIRDGVIEASIDHEKGWLQSTEQGDLYSTDEPQKSFHRRINFCLDVHNEAIKSMRYPPDAYKKELQVSSKQKDQEKTIEELIKEMEEEED